ncbi:MAG: hypothetical protein M1825_006291 [Sarcosagium campestre]|nr:MAG: hypothetical protein M1825_006291 [Sarcosagium campestre]
MNTINEHWSPYAREELAILRLHTDATWVQVYQHFQDARGFQGTKNAVQMRFSRMKRFGDIAYRRVKGMTSKSWEVVRLAKELGVNVIDSSRT